MEKNNKRSLLTGLVNKTLKGKQVHLTVFTHSRLEKGRKCEHI